jgi:hypothetical protein
MIRDLGLFFPPGSRVLALPNWRRPRLYLLARRFSQRWKVSSFYPASRLQARFYRLSLRIAATAGISEVRTIHSSDWPLGRLTEDIVPQLGNVGVLVTTSRAGRKAVVQLRDEEGRVFGYLKYAEQEAARRLLRHEHNILSALPGELGPEPLKYGDLGSGEALLMTPIAGSKLPVTVPPADGVLDYLMALAISVPVSTEAHPWVLHIGRLNDQRSWIEDCFEALANRRWPVTIQHGDFAPWNMLRMPGGKIEAYDWEYATLEGFPYLDYAYYILQTLILIYRWAPTKAAQYAERCLMREPQIALSNSEARAIVRLAAYDAYQKYLHGGQEPSTSLQTWRRAIWENKSCSV